jgi:hypothetical protein
MRATVAAARPRIRMGRPTASVAENPMIGASRIEATPESNAAATHAMVETRRTGIPSRRARGPFSAAARSATP